MPDIIIKNFNKPDEAQSMEKAKMESLTLDGINVYRMTAEPGWQWSKHLKPIVGGESCQRHHLFYIISGKMFAQMENGQPKEFGPGDVVVIPPGHDGWNAGTEPVVWLELPH